MSGFEIQFAYLRNARLAAHATSALPIWLWQLDARGMLWANPTGAAIFNAASPAAAAALRFDPTDPAAVQIARLAHTLPQAGMPRLERLRGFGAGVGSTLTCSCARMTLADDTAAILVVALERAGPDLSLAERTRRLLADLDAPVAAFLPDGALVHASAAATARLSGGGDIAALGGETAMAKALHDGMAEAGGTHGAVSLLRLGDDKAPILLALFGAPEPTATPEVASSPLPPPVGLAPVGSPVLPERKHPLRFIWQIDADNRFTLDSAEFIEAIGPRTAAVLGRPWPEIVAELMLDPAGEVTRALASRDTWSGIAVSWPVDGGDQRLPVELSAIPVFDHDHGFRGYRGFGICRDIARLSALAQARRAAAPPAIMLTAANTGGKVLPFPSPSVEKPAGLSAGERKAFQELGRELSDRLNKTREIVTDDNSVKQPRPAVAGSLLRSETERESSPEPERPILDRLPNGILVYRLNDLLYANRAFLDWTGYRTLDALMMAGGLERLFIEPGADTPGRDGGKSLAVSTRGGAKLPVEGRLFSVSWQGENALLLTLSTTAEPGDKATALALRAAEAANREIDAILDTATDGVLVLDRAGRVSSANRSAEALFGEDTAALAGGSFGDLFAPESRRAALDYLDRIARNGTAGLLNQGKEVVGRTRRGGLIPLFMTVGRVGEDGEKFCAVFRDLTVWKKTEEELLTAKQQAEKISATKTEFLAKVSHNIRTPLNTIIGFSEVMMDERFGPIGNDRYRQYLRDIHESGGHLVALLNDLLDLAKIETGKLDLTFTGVQLNDLVQQCVAIMQAQANRERIIIRSALSPALPQVVADARSVRQLVLNLLSNSIKLAGAGGQVIVSTKLTDDNEAVLHVRDTGSGMSGRELEMALEPFRHLATSTRWGAGDTGLVLPITKALAEANHARFYIKSAIEDGTLVEVAFPATRVLAQ